MSSNEFQTRDFGLLLRTLRKELGLTQDQLGQNLGVTRSAIAFYEKGERTPDLSFLYKAAEYFEVSADFLLGRQKYRKSAHIDIGQATGLWDSNIRALCYVAEGWNLACTKSTDNPNSLANDLVHYYDTINLMTNLLLSCFLAHQEEEEDMVHFPQQLEHYLRFTTGQVAHSFAYAPLKAKLSDYDEKAAMATEKALIAGAQQELIDSFLDILGEIQNRYQEYLDSPCD